MTGRLTRAGDVRSEASYYSSGGWTERSRTQLNALNAFADFLERSDMPLQADQVRPKHVKAYLRDLAKQGWRGADIAAQYDILWVFWRHEVQYRGLKKSPMRWIRRPRVGPRVPGLLQGALVAVPVFALPWHLWGMWSWACILLGLAFVLLVPAYMESQSSGRPGAELALAICLGGPLWALGFGGWPLLLGALAALLVLRAATDAMDKLKARRERQRILDEKRRQPGWTGKECMACHSPVPASTMPGDRCPHCHVQFGAEVRW